MLQRRCGSVLCAALTMVTLGGCSGVLDGPTLNNGDAGASKDAEVCSGQQVCMEDSDCSCDGVCAARRCVRRAACGEVLVRWKGPVQNVDGSCAEDLAGYRLWWGPSVDQLDNMHEAGLPCRDGPLLSCGSEGKQIPQPYCAYRFTDLPVGTWTFAATVYNKLNEESDKSNSAEKTIGACKP